MNHSNVAPPGIEEPAMDPKPITLYERYVARVCGGALRAQMETTLTLRDGETHLEILWMGTGRTPLLRILLPFMRRKIARQALADLVELKELVEGQPRRGSSPPPAPPLDQVAN